VQWRWETVGFGLVLAACLAGFFHKTLLGDRVLSPADVLLVEASFRESGADDYEPLNRLLMDPVLQFQPWLEFNRSMIRQVRLPLWNPHAGCGAPHLANGQSSVFDPFCLLAYFGRPPWVWAPMAAGRLWVAGLGMFLLARAWGLGACGRWFAGLVYPFCGFLIVWLLYPVTPVAVWLPWIILATDRVLREPRARPTGLLAVVTALVIVGGHIQTSAHVLLAAGLFALWRSLAVKAPVSQRRGGLLAWTAGTGLGLLLASVQILPLGCYLARSPVWGDRQREGKPWWTLSRPRLLDAACTALPYAYGSQRRGHPNLARGLAVHNLNESAGGYAGLVTLVWLAPLGLRNERRASEISFLTGLTLIGAMGAFQLPPVDNLLRALPVIEVTDNRRLVLWVAFGLTLLGASGLDALARGERPARATTIVCLLGGVVVGSIAVSAPAFKAMLQERARRHYESASRLAPAIAPALAERRAERQVSSALDFVPRYYGLAAGEFFVLAGLAAAARRGLLGTRWMCPGLLALTMAELVGFGIELNPAIEAATDRLGPPVIARLRLGLRPGERALGIGEELPPNVLMRYGLSDPRNYDSVELARSLRWFETLYEPGEAAQTSRRQISWEGVLRARQRLREASVAAVVGSARPPAGQFDRVEQVGSVWIAWLETPGWASSQSGSTRLAASRGPNSISLDAHAIAADRVIIRDTWDPGWTALVDGKPAAVEQDRATFLAVAVPPGDHRVELAYQPAEVKWGLALTALGGCGAILALTRFGYF
jgi:hypothetical protein